MAALPGSSEDSALQCWANTPQTAGSLLPEHPQGPPVMCHVPRSDHSQCLARHCSLRGQVQEQRRPGPGLCQGAGLGLGAGAEQLAELLMEGVRNPQLPAPWSWLLWLGKQQQSRVSMGMYTACWAQLHPEILPGLGTGSCCRPLLPAWPRRATAKAAPRLSQPPRLCFRSPAAELPPGQGL